MPLLRNMGGKRQVGALRDAAEAPGRLPPPPPGTPFPPQPGRAGAACGESVVNVVPNPKWLLRNGNPIKVLLVYLSSSGLFITVQMAATFARHSSVLARARRAEAPTPQSLCLHLRGAAGPASRPVPRASTTTALDKAVTKPGPSPDGV